MLKEKQQEERRDDIVHALHVGRSRVPHRPHVQHSLHALNIIMGKLKKIMIFLGENCCNKKQTYALIYYVTLEMENSFAKNI